MKVAVYLVLLMIWLSGCLHPRPQKTHVPRYGVEHNGIRDSLGITLLDTSWAVIDMWDDVTIWGPKEEQPHPRHTYKSIAYFNDTLYCEHDMYGNGEKYQTLEGPEPVSLTIWYFYRPPRTGPWKWVAQKKDSIGWYYEFCNDITSDWINKAQADSILTSWGLKY